MIIPFLGNGLNEHNELFSHHLQPKIWKHAVVMADVFSDYRKEDALSIGIESANGHHLGRFEHGLLDQIRFEISTSKLKTCLPGSSQVQHIKKSTTCLL